VSLVFSKLRSPWKRWGPGRKREDRWSVQLAKNQTILDKSQVPPAFRPRGPAKKQVSSAIDQVSIVFFRRYHLFFRSSGLLGSGVGLEEREHRWSVQFAKNQTILDKSGAICFSRATCAPHFTPQHWLLCHMGL